MPIAVGSKGIDSASPNVDDNAAAAAGSRFHIRYSAAAASLQSNSSFKNNAGKLTRLGEIAKINNSGQFFGVSDEWYTNRIIEGAAAAEEDAPAVLQFWRTNGLAPGTTINLNLDTGYHGEIAQIEAYFDRYNQILDSEYLANGFYGPLAAMRPLAQSGRIKHYWVPEASSWFEDRAYIDPNYAPPAKTNWDLWEPTPSQVAPAMKYIMDAIGSDSNLLESIIWQDKNHLYGGSCDENIVLKGDHLGMHGETGGVSTPAPSSLPTATPVPSGSKLWQNYPVPALIAHGSNQYLGDIDGDNRSHGGINQAERDIIRVLQQRLIVCGFVPGHSNPDDGWADGIFNLKGDGSLGGPTSNAVAMFQHMYMPNTEFYGQVWDDDWRKLFSL